MHTGRRYIPTCTHSYIKVSETGEAGWEIQGGWLGWKMSEFHGATPSAIHNESCYSYLVLGWLMNPCLCTSSELHLASPFTSYFASLRSIDSTPRETRCIRSYGMNYDARMANDVCKELYFANLRFRSFVPVLKKLRKLSWVSVCNFQEIYNVLASHSKRIHLIFLHSKTSLDTKSCNHCGNYSVWGNLIVSIFLSIFPYLRTKWITINSSSKYQTQVTAEIIVSEEIWSLLLLSLQFFQSFQFLRTNQTKVNRFYSSLLIF